MNDEEFEESVRRNADDIERYLLRSLKGPLRRLLIQLTLWLLFLAAAVAVLVWQWGAVVAGVVVAVVAVPSVTFGWWSWRRQHARRFDHD